MSTSASLRNSKLDVAIIAGSGRSGTTWLGSILNSYEHADYFYEICAYPELDFDGSNLLQVKYPLTSWMPKHPLWASKLERYALKQRIKLGIGREAAQRSLRIHSGHEFKKKEPTVNLFKIVALFAFASKIDRLDDKFGERLKVVHIIRNPFSQLASEIRMDSRDPERSRKHFKERMEAILQEERFAKYHDLVRKYLHGSWVEHMALVWWISNELLLNDTRLDKRLVVYEDLCRSPYEKTQELFEFLGWDMSGQTLAHIEQTTNVSKADAESGMFSIKKNADESINRWRGEMAPDTYKTINDVLAACPLLQYWSEEDLSYGEKHA